MQFARPGNKLGRGGPVAGIRLFVTGTPLLATTDAGGEFVFPSLPACEIELALAAEPYQGLKLSLKPGVENRVEITLDRTVGNLSETMVVTVEQNSAAERGASPAHTIDRRVAQSIAPAAMQDPIGALKMLPGVSGNDDLTSRINLRGAAMRRTAFYLDGVAADAPAHAINEEQGGGSVSMLDAETIGSLTVLPGAAPARYGDNTAGVVVFETREGSRDRPAFRLSSGLLNTSGAADGPMVKARGSWLLTARRSYLNYALRRLRRPGIVFDFTDLQGQAVYDLNERHRIGLTALSGEANVNQRGLSVTAGLRIESYGATGETHVAPHLAAGFALGGETAIRLGWSRHSQPPDPDHLFGFGGNSRLRSERADHLSLRIERNLGERALATMELYDRRDRRLIFSLDQELRRAGLDQTGRHPLGNSVYGYARGVELTLQRRNPGRFDGWLSYSYARTGLRDRSSGIYFVSDADQLHAISAFASYRFDELYDFSGTWKYGSGMTIAGFAPATAWPVTPGALPARNRYRLPVYNRVDLRLNRRFAFERFKLTLTLEFLNAFGRKNLRQAGNGVEPTLPFLPSGGVTITF
jgi:hypothetical protein